MDETLRGLDEWKTAAYHWADEAQKLHVQRDAAIRERDETAAICQGYWDWEYGDAEIPPTAILVAWAKKCGLEATRGSPDQEFNPYARDLNVALARVRRLEWALHDMINVYYPTDGFGETAGEDAYKKARAALANTAPASTEGQADGE